MAPPGEHLASIVYWPDERLLFVAAPRSPMIDVLRVPTAPREGTLDFVGQLRTPGGQEILRLALDPANGRLWAADREAIHVYPLRPLGAPTRIAFRPPGINPIDDLVLDAEGNGFVFIAGGARIDRVPALTLRPERWLEAPWLAPRASRFATGRAVAARDGRQLLFQLPRNGGLLRVDRASRETLTIHRAAPIVLDCAALLWHDGESRPVLHCRGRSTVEIELDPAMTRLSERRFP